MKITGVTPYLVGPRPSSDGWSEGQIVIFVKLETDTGLVGWGEAYALSLRQRAIREIVIELGEALKRMSEATPRAFLHHIAKPMDTKHPGIDYSSAVSAIEIALWDLLGKTRANPYMHCLVALSLTKCRSMPMPGMSRCKRPRPLPTDAP